MTAQIPLVPPFYENFGKRLVKSPKLYFVDSGLASHFLGTTSEGELNRSPFLGNATQHIALPERTSSLVRDHLSRRFDMVVVEESGEVT